MKGLILDLDGTLLDSMGMWEALDRRFLMDHGIEPPRDISKIVKKMNLEDSAEYFVKRFGLSLSAAEVVREIEEMAADAYQYDLPLKPFAREFLAEVCHRRIPCTLASVTYPSLLFAALRRLSIEQCFQAVVTKDDCPLGKHTAQMYHTASRKLGFPPEDICVVEDALYAVQTAKDAGYFTVGFEDETEKEDAAALAVLSDRCVKSWSELLSPDFLNLFH